MHDPWLDDPRNGPHLTPGCARRPVELATASLVTASLLTLGVGATVVLVVLVASAAFAWWALVETWRRGEFFADDFEGITERERVRQALDGDR